MRRFILSLSVLAASALCLLPAWGEAPQKVVEIASVDDLVAEINAKVELLGQQVSSAEAFAMTVEKKEVNQAAGVVACMAQAIVEHPDKAKAKFHAADLRDAAVLLRAAKTFEDATKLFAAVKDAHAGKSAGTAKPEAEWNKLTSLGRMMEEINGRSATIRRGLRRLAKPEETARDCSTLAILALAMEVDTHEVKDPAQLPLWKELSVKYRSEMIAMSKAVRAKDTAKATEHFTAANEACNKCHEKIRDKDK
ncbi:MAG: cytochrome c [Planctomycetaceae bacterium]|nr:cytochrome c [Planctomycetaceae bacterium]